jgi:hypothetical protein
VATGFKSKQLLFIVLAQKPDRLPKREEAFATGEAGTVYKCHSFIVHPAQTIMARNLNLCRNRPCY